ncbi:MAG: anti-sigma factor antagonist [Planctomycetota bacterium]|nr:MAG: anti-sigma factor antagonist [Planctomycetota bacterium]
MDYRSLDIKERQADDVTVLKLSGQLTMGLASSGLKEQLDAAVAQGRRHILLSVAELSYIDSYGLGELVACLTTVKKSGGALKLAGPTPFVRDVMRTTRLDTLFETYGSEEEALASFNEPTN